MKSQETKNSQISKGMRQVKGQLKAKAEEVNASSSEKAVEGCKVRKQIKTNW